MTAHHLPVYQQNYCPTVPLVSRTHCALRGCTAGVDGARTMGFKSMLAVSGKAHSTREDAAVSMKEATCSRLLPGQGDIPLQEILRYLRELDCQPLMGLEISSLAMNKLSPEQAAQQAMSAYRKISESDQASI